MLRTRKTCFVFDTVAHSGFPLENLERFRAATNGRCDFRYTIHSDDAEILTDSEAITHSSADILEVVPHSKDVSRGVIPGNFDLKMIRLMSDLPEFDTIIRVEYDVVCSEKDWGLAVERLIQVADGVDFAASFIRRYSPTDTWMWWPSLELPEISGRQMKIEDAYKCFCPISSFSRRFTETYSEYLRLGLQGHAEATLATVAIDGGLTTASLSSASLNLTRFPQFTYDRPKKLHEYLPTFIHPVKSNADFETVSEYFKVQPD